MTGSGLNTAEPSAALLVSFGKLALQVGNIVAEAILLQKDVFELVLEQHYALLHQEACRFSNSKPHFSGS